MFQYAAARRLAIMRQTSLKLDVSSYPLQTLRTYRLNCFNIKEEFATSEEVASLTGDTARGFRPAFLHILQRLRLHSPSSFMVEHPSFHFDSRILNAPANVYLKGYWQSEQYFIDVGDLIRTEFTLRDSPDKYSCEIAAQIKHTTAVALHVRRTDYISNPRAHKYHGVCTLDYYYQCIQLVLEKHPRVHLFVFSDEPDWVENNLQIDNPMTIVSRPDKEHEDLWLMSLCEHFIIANSSYSWWGAWLSRNPNKTVFAPRRWFSGKSIVNRDLIPGNWQKV